MIFADHPEWLDAPVLWGQNPQRLWHDVELFLERVDTERFPIYTGIDYLEEDEIAFILYQPPLTPLGLSFWYDGMEQIENYKEPLHLIAIIQLREFVEPETADEIIADAYPDLTIPDDMDLGELLPIIEQMLAEATWPTPLNGLPDMIRWVQSATDNNWLDICPEELAEMGMVDHWENWAQLTADWQSAKVMMDRITALLDWVYPAADGGEPQFDPARWESVWHMLATAHAHRPINHDS